jgi:DNA replication protein DnaC
MTSVDPTLTTTTLLANVRRLGLTHTAESLDDLIARATRSRWSPTVLLDTLVQAELDARARRRLERQLQAARLGRFKPLADFEWTWPKQLDRPTVDRVFSLDFIAKRECRPGRRPRARQDHATKNLLHQAVLAGHSALFITASDLLLDLNGQDTSRALERRLRAYARPQILAIDEIGYLAYDAHAADLLFQVISRRYEQRSIVVTTNLLFKHWDTVFPNASCAVALIDRLTHHAEIIPIEGESYRKREAELTQKKRRAAS